MQLSGGIFFCILLQSWNLKTMTHVRELHSLSQFWLLYLLLSSVVENELQQVTNEILSTEFAIY